MRIKRFIKLDFIGFFDYFIRFTEASNDSEKGAFHVYFNRFNRIKRIEITNETDFLHETIARIDFKYSFKKEIRTYYNNQGHKTCDSYGAHRKVFKIGRRRIYMKHFDANGMPIHSSFGVFGYSFGKRNESSMNYDICQGI